MTLKQSHNNVHLFSQYDNLHLDRPSQHNNFTNQSLQIHNYSNSLSFPNHSSHAVAFTNNKSGAQINRPSIDWHPGALSIQCYGKARLFGNGAYRGLIECSELGARPCCATAVLPQSSWTEYLTPSIGTGTLALAPDWSLASCTEAVVFHPAWGVGEASPETQRRLKANAEALINCILYGWLRVFFGRSLWGYWKTWKFGRCALIELLVDITFTTDLRRFIYMLMEAGYSTGFGCLVGNS